MSNIAGRSEITKFSKVAEVSPIVQCGDTSKFTSDFWKALESNFDEFREQVHEEYLKMR